ncbi:MAG TPA: TolC family protein, partial [Bacteroidales bacterium]|nr:TolC family protein [Bacteroidales bacterium]
IPVGLFYPVPTDATQAIKFGTKWQQSLGLSLYQPLIDRTVKTRLAGSRINEKIENNNLVSAEEDLKYEVINSYLLIWLKEQQLNVSALDSAGTFATLQLLKAGYDDGKVYETDLNTARINHNKALSLFRESYSALLKEKIYMSFLTGIQLESLLTDEYDFTPFENDSLFSVSSGPYFDSIPSLTEIRLNSKLTENKIRSERATHMPKAGIEGFVGTNQYTQQFKPTGSAGWYGSSYVGLSLKMPIISGSGSASRIKQLRLQKESLEYRLKDRKADITSQNLKLKGDIESLEEQAELAGCNEDLLKRNLAIYRDRLSKGLIRTYDLLNSETDFREAVIEAEKLRTNLYLKKLELIRNSGMLGFFLQKLK